MEILQIIKDMAPKYNLDPAIIYGICIQESNLNPAACRYEAHYKWLYKPSEVKPKLSSLATEEIFQKVSWGISQLMGGVLREYGYTDWLPVILSNINDQILYTCVHLSKLKKRFKNDHDYISAYNAGSPRKDDYGRYINQTYVNNVLKYSKGFK